ncbi:MFS transporter [Arthrobacter sp. 131MFCol6.1]|uniref:MFS transporter n=1 Tax=Arthrobacter sp. 131MFCol6.1 TaxID=1157944 RepID=UPI00036288AF|nr:MFS transporter [Arthrobacter sp. 131MFCol6.1]
MTQTQHYAPDRTRNSGTLPLAGLLALAAAGFITIMLETLPAGILPAMSGDLGVSESAVGQTVTVFAIGSIAGAIPLISATMGWQRRKLLLLALTGYAVTSVVTAVSDNFVLTLIIRFVAGVFAGVLWGILATYARRMVTPNHHGRAITIALAGTPVALAIGTPAGTLLAGLIGWRFTFGVMALLALLLITWVLAAVPDFAGQAKGERTPVARVFSAPGVLPVVIVTLLYVMAHNLLYTYIASFLAPVGMSDSVSAVLLVFGVASLVSIWITGALIDRHLRTLMIASSALFALAVLALGILADLPAAVFISAALWGLAFGGAASLLQTAAADAGGPAVDLVQSVMVTGWNIGIAGGGIIGGLLLSGFGASSLAWATFALLIAALIIVTTARKQAFPA